MIRNFLILMLALMSNFAMAQSQSISGKITGVDKEALIGATVIIKETKQGTVTDVNGIFKIANVEKGDYTLNVNFIGYKDFVKQISVGSEGLNLSLNLEEDAQMIDQVVIATSYLDGQAKSLNLQKKSLNITNMVSADQVGKFPDANIGDAMKRIPGITMQYDQGEARFGIIRGTAPGLNSVMINGERVPSAEGETRAVQLDLIPSDMIQSIEVNKSVTPDMDADAIGGAVNLKTREASSQTRISATAASGYTPLTDKPIWTGGLVFGKRFFDDKLGLVLSSSYNYREFGSDNIEAEWDEDDYVKELQIRKYRVTRERKSIAANFDFKLNEKHTFYLKGMYSQRNDWENRYKLKMEFDEPNENGISEGKDTKIYVETKGGSDRDRVKNQRLEDQRTRFFSLGAKHDFSDILKVNWTASIAKASEERPDERYIAYEYEGEEDDNDEYISGSSPRVRNNFSNPRRPKASLIDGADYSKFKLADLYEEQQYTEEIDKNLRIDFEMPLSDVFTLKYGARYRGKEKMRDNRLNENESKVFEDKYETMDLFPTSNQTSEDFMPGSEYKSGEFPTREALGSLNPAIFTKKDYEKVAENYEATENISAGYVMGTFNLGKLTAMTGLRIENTAIEYTGYEFNKEKADEQEDNYKPDVLNNSKNYTNYLPAIHLRYDINDNFPIRFAWTNTLARPKYIDLVPYRLVKEKRESLEIGNPELEVTKAMNFDLTTEYYFQKVGLLSGGLFYKRLNNFIYKYEIDDFKDPVTGDTFDEATQYKNGDNASLYGIELAAQHQLDYLPGLLNGFVVYANYTYTESEANYPHREEKTALEGTAGHTWNASLAYEKGGFNARISANYTNSYIDELGDEAFEDEYYDQQFFLDINASYAINNNWRVFAEAKNLTNQPLRYFQGTSERTFQEEFYGSSFNLGIKFDLIK